MQTTTLTAVVHPSDKEKMEAIIKATCVYYSLTEEELVRADKSMDSTAARYQCFYLIAINTSIKPKRIGHRLCKSRQVVLKAKGIIELHKTIYGQTRDTLKAIVAIANTFEKTTEWHIQ